MKSLATTYNSVRERVHAQDLCKQKGSISTRRSLAIAVGAARRNLQERRKGAENSLSKKFELNS